MGAIGPGAVPKGKPFVYINDQIIDVQDDIADMQDILDDALSDITTIEGQIAWLTTELASLEIDVVANADAIDVVESSLASVEAALLTKQTIASGVCPAGQAMVSVNTGANDGTIVCAVTGGSLDITYVTAFAFAPASASPTGQANCPAGYSVVGGGGSWHAGLRNSEPLGGNSWRLSGSVGTGGGFAVMLIHAVCQQ